MKARLAIPLLAVLIIWALPRVQGVTTGLIPLTIPYGLGLPLGQVSAQTNSDPDNTTHSNVSIILDLSGPAVNGNPIREEALLVAYAVSLNTAAAGGWISTVTSYTSGYDHFKGMDSDPGALGWTTVGPFNGTNRHSIGGDTGDMIYNHAKTNMVNISVTFPNPGVPLIIAVVSLATGNWTVEFMDQYYNTYQGRAITSAAAVEVFSIYATANGTTTVVGAPNVSSNTTTTAVVPWYTEVGNVLGSVVNTWLPYIIALAGGIPLVVSTIKNKAKNNGPDSIKSSG